MMNTQAVRCPAEWSRPAKREKRRAAVSFAALRRSIAAYLETHTAAFWFFSYIGIPVLLLSGVSALACLFALPCCCFVERTCFSLPPRDVRELFLFAEFIYFQF